MLNSAVGVSKSLSAVNFLLKDSTDTVSCIFYQIVSIIFLLLARPRSV